MDCSPPGSSVHGILQARILDWVAISFYFTRAALTEPQAGCFKMIEIHCLKALKARSLNLSGSHEPLQGVG